MKKFLSEAWRGQSALACPGCENENLHHFEVDVFNPKQEDAAEGIHVLVIGDDIRHSKATLVIDAKMEGNPSDRRHGLSVRFWCEQCDAISAMTIVQHKGTTYVGMQVIAHSEDKGLDF
jgi:hypothetical protein